MNFQLANYASCAKKSTKLYSEQNSSGRSQFQKDRDRIIHCNAFRRLEYKTQVFINNEGDHYRTRLTHSLEVAQLARSIARILGLDEDLSEAISLSHDLGHSPFGHAGEDALKEVMQDYGGFDHNAQTIRILTKLEKKHPNFDGLNLTWECLEGLAKHNGPVAKPPRALKEYNKIHNLKLNTYPSLEAQLASVSDDIAYNSHDIEDGIKAGLFTVEEVSEVKIIGNIIKNIHKKFPKIPQNILLHETRSNFIRIMIDDILTNTAKNIEKYKINSANDVRNAGKLICDFSDEFKKELKKVKEFLMEKMYRHYKVLIMTTKAKRIVKELFLFYLENPNCLPLEWLENIEDTTDKTDIAHTVVDFIAGMTDRYAYIQYKKIFDVDYTNL
jgi:dGTPase